MQVVNLISVSFLICCFFNAIGIVKEETITTCTLPLLQEIRLKLQAGNHDSGIGFAPHETSCFQGSVKIGRAANIVAHLHAIAAVCVVDLAGFSDQA